MKKTFRPRVMIVVLLFITYLLISTTGYAWFAIGDRSVDHQIKNGSVLQQYFHCGTGTDLDPFVITRPNHYYHLVELYQRKNDFADPDLCFSVGYPYSALKNEASMLGKPFYVLTDTGGERFIGSQSVTLAESYGENPDYSKILSTDYTTLTEDDGGCWVYAYDANGDQLFIVDQNEVRTPIYTKVLNMNVYSDGKKTDLVPTGTTEVPFVGEIAGNGLTLGNMHIKAIKEENGRVFKTSDVGIFGYISGELDGSEYVGARIHDIFFDNVTIDVTGLASGIGSKNSYTHTDHTEDEKVYVGYLVGHMDIVECNSDGTALTQNIFDRVYVNNCRVIGGTLTGSGTTAVNEYGYIGHVDTMTGAKFASLIEQIEKATSTTSANNGAGTDAGWGGSMDMYALFQRANSILRSTTTNGVNRSQNYPTAETVTEPDSLSGQSTVTMGTTTAMGDSSYGGVYFWSGATSGKQGTGNYIGNATENFTYIYGLKNPGTSPEADPAQTTRTTVYTKTGELVPALYIASGTHYLSETDAALTETTRQASAAKWIADTNNKYYTYVNNTRYYLLLDTAGSAVRGVKIQDCADTAATRWDTNGDGELYTTSNGITYYLVYDNGWDVTQFKSYYAIGNGEGRYLIADAGLAVANTTNANTAHMWQIANPSGNTTFSFVRRGETYYLGFDGTNLAITTTETTWTREGDHYYVTSADERFYLLYASRWQAKMIEGKKITDGQGHFLTVSTDPLGLTNGSENVGSVFTVAPSGIGYTFGTVANNVKQYLGFDGGALTLRTSPTVWNYDNEADGYYVTVDGYRWYLTYQNGWTAVSNLYHTVSDGNGHYLNADGANAVTVGEDEGTATKWYFTSLGETPAGNVWTVVNGQKRFLHQTGGTLSLSGTASTSWTNNGTNFYTQDGAHVYHLRYDGGWKLYDAVRYRFYKNVNGTNHYLVFNGSSFSDTTAAASATGWTYEETSTGVGTYSTEVGGRTYYLTLTGSGIGAETTKSANSTLNTQNGAIYREETRAGDGNVLRHALQYDGGWKVKTINNGYVIHDGNGNYLRVTGTNSFNNATSLDDATRFTVSGNTIYVTIGGRNYYLRNNSGTLQISTTSSDWTVGSNNLSSTYSSWFTSTTCYLFCDNGTWKLTEDSGDIAATTYYRIKNSDGYYLAAEAGSTTLIASTDVSKAVLFTSAPSGSASTLSTTINGRTYYLYADRSDGGAVFLSRSSRQWTLLGNKLYYYRNANNSYYIQRNGTSWQVRTAQGNGNNFTVETYNMPAKRSERTQIDETLPTVSTSNYTVAVPAISVTKKDASFTPIELADYTAEPVDAALDQVTKTFPVTFTDTTETLYASEVITKQRGSYFPIRVAVSGDDDYDANNVYKVSAKNTGYIIGGAYSGAGGQGQGDIRISRYAMSNIGNSVSYSGQTVTYLTKTENGKTYPAIYTYAPVNGNVQKTLVTKDTSVTVNGETVDTDYGRILKDFKAMLAEDTNYVYGLHFMDAKIGTNHLISAESVTINGKTHINYELPESCIDFNVDRQGNISFIAGDYFSNSNAFFSLNQIFRNDDTTIKKILQIEAVYEKKSGTTKNYIYKYTDSTGNVTYSNENGSYTGAKALDNAYNATPVFDMQWIMNPGSLSGSNLYFFSIPCNAGEYALGSVDGKTGDYLLYLDIATNGGGASTAIGTEDRPTAVVSDNPLFTDIDYRSEPYNDTMEDFTHNSIFNLAYTLPEGATDEEKFSVGVEFEWASDRDDYSDISEWCRGVYKVYITNETGNAFDISFLLCDDDDDPENVFMYAYEVYLNGVLLNGNESTGYTGSLRRWSKTYSCDGESLSDVVP